ncbi:MAG TPA: hypothetical protein VFQ73_01145 [Flavisolibacter sp.]|nr:hypothetical protein [Flavisolibacter sp.]
MKTTTLVFPSFEALWEFKQTTNTLNFKINSVSLTITAQWNEAQIELALTKFKASVAKSKAA